MKIYSFYTILAIVIFLSLFGGWIVSSAIIDKYEEDITKEAIENYKKNVSLDVENPTGYTQRNDHHIYLYNGHDTSNIVYVYEDGTLNIVKCGCEVENPNFVNLKEHDPFQKVED